MYRGSFSSKEDIAREYSIDVKELDEAEIIYATYTYANYSGSSFVLFTQYGKLYEVNGSHCSCNGLEGQWSPEETSWEAIAIRPTKTYDGEEEFEDFEKVLTSFYFERDILRS